MDEKQPEPTREQVHAVLDEAARLRALAEGKRFEPPAETLEQRQLECGIPFWPHGFVTAHCDVDAAIEAWNNEYACLGYGAHLYEELKAFCEQTGIHAVAL